MDQGQEMELDPKKIRSWPLVQFLWDKSAPRYYETCSKVQITKVHKPRWWWVNIVIEQQPPIL